MEPEGLVLCSQDPFISLSIMYMVHMGREAGSLCLFYMF